MHVLGGGEGVDKLEYTRSLIIISFHSISNIIYKFLYGIIDHFVEYTDKQFVCLICYYMQLVSFSGMLRHSVGVFQLIFGTQYFCLFGSLDESMLKILV